MQQDRFKILEELLKSEPDDPFNQYAYALELKKVDAQKATLILKKLAQKTPEYLPTYYLLGTWLTDEEDYDEAISVLQKGVEVANEQGNDKIEKELKGALQIAQNEQEEW